MVRVSTVSKQHIDWRILIAFAALVAVVFYLAVSAVIFRVGFPLDDAWIHLTYARNFAEFGEWAYRIGEHSAGSTSPLWTAFLAIGFILHLGPYVWTYFLGWVVLTLMAVYFENTARQLVESYRPQIPWAGLFIVFEWHLTWSAVSGMETLLHGLIILIVLASLTTGSRRYLTLGLLAGISIWVRPDGLTLLGPVLFTTFLWEKTWRLRGEALLKIAIGVGALFLPYLLFNLMLSGNPLPNTFYAKQAEYQAYSLLPLSVRLNEYLSHIIASPFLVLIPGAGIWFYKIIYERNWGAISGVVWFIGYISIYFMRLPAYQHGRYLIPALPIMYLWGVLGMIHLVASGKVNKLIVLVWQLLAGMLCLGFSFYVARQNAYDVYWIESEMVNTAKWVRQNIPSNALIAVHDIGAMGYYTPNPLIDLAGLITPDVVPFIRDEARLVDYLNARSVEYLVVFPSQYPKLVSHKAAVFTAGLEFDPINIEEDLRVYRWK